MRVGIFCSTLRMEEVLSSEVIIKATVSKVQPTMQTMSLPPQIICQVFVTGVALLRGAAAPKDVFQMRFVGKVDLVKGSTYLFGGKMSDGAVFFEAHSPYSEEAERQVRQAIFGWKQGRSPFTTPVNTKEQGDVQCSATGRPTLTSTEGLAISSAQVIPPNAHEYRNPYGDGVFKLTIKNTGKTARKVPLFVGVSSGKVYGELSTVAASGNDEEGDVNYYTWDEKVDEEVKFLELEAGKSVDFEVNCLKLRQQFPNGGMRVYYTFGVGNLVCANFFYYYSSVHDNMVAACRK